MREAVAEFFGPIVHANLETGGLEPLCVILAVQSHVVELPESSFSFLVIRNSPVFNRGCQCPRDGDLEYGIPAGFQHAMQFGHGFPVVIDVLKHVIAYDEVKPVIRKMYIGDIHPEDVVFRV